MTAKVRLVREKHKFIFKNLDLEFRSLEDLSDEETAYFNEVEALGTARDNHIFKLIDEYELQIYRTIVNNLRVRLNDLEQSNAEAERVAEDLQFFEDLVQIKSEFNNYVQAGSFLNGKFGYMDRYFREMKAIRERRKLKNVL